VAVEQAEELGELLQGLSVCPPSPLEQLEVVLRPPAAGGAAPDGAPPGWKPDLRLQHDLTPPGGGVQADSEAGNR
jgi:hypothetical protein